MQKLRLAVVGVIGALVGGAGLVFPTSAQAAPTYWTFQNVGFGTCLTAGDTGTAFATSCVGSTRQQWDWSSASAGDYHMLVNRNTGQCLRTDNRTGTNAVWTSTCDGSSGEWWYYNGENGSIINLLGENDGCLLRTSTTKDGVYATDPDQAGIPHSYYQWTGTHD
ncbi:RICIN domain-containing protein [Streptomyces sp. NPDC059378]|uniref:RICIN domain-containing protein n=1 Tax=Streptomyces sp. NPDC059378 TaxID=3346815 RepID=UPI0036A736AB